MSDDTPTERYDAARGDAPTERLATPASTAPVPLEVQEERKSRRLIIILAAVGGALLLAVLVVLIILLTRGNGTPTALPTSSATPTSTASASATPSATATPSPTPSATTAPTPTTPPPSNTVAITGFSGTVQGSPCSSQTGNRVNVLIEWASNNGVVAYFAVGDVPDAESQGMGWTLPPSGNSNDFPAGFVPYEFQCSNANNLYTITIVGTGGDRQTKSIAVANTGDVF